MEKQLKRWIADAFVVYLWKRGDFGVEDDLAYVAMLRMRELIEEALSVLEHEAPVEGSEK